MSITITKEQFFKEVVTLREMWGTKDFWADPKKVQLAKKAITVAYFGVEKTTPQKDQDHVVDTYLATMAEFNRRAELLGVQL